jgi:hypothetical protein
MFPFKALYVKKEQNLNFVIINSITNIHIPGKPFKVSDVVRIVKTPVRDVWTFGFAA